MNSTERRAYHSPLRQAQTQETRERILAAVGTWLQHDTNGDVTLDAIASEARIERRTVFRHFATKEALLEAFWVWVNLRVAPRVLPETLDDLLNAPRETFARFDDQEGVIRASLHTPTGRAMRSAVIDDRRRAFSAALREVTSSATPAERRRLTAVVHALYSAAAWETMRDYAGVTGAQAGDAASWAIEVLVNFVRSRSASAPASDDPPSNENQHRKNTMNITRVADAEALWVIRDRIRFMGKLDGTDLNVLEVEVPPGSGTPPHMHESPEIFRVLTGEITFGQFDGPAPIETVATTGTVVTVPSQIPHNYRNAGETPASMLVVVERSMSDFFRDVGVREPPPARPPTAEEIGRIMAACERHGIRVLGGAPA
jgi:AcrR family transcriptional regulator/uncharacterized RmlC-like cupin family protein